MILKYAIAFSGGYDSSYFLKQICQKRQSYKYLLINFYTKDRIEYSYTHFTIIQIAYNWNIKCVIIKNNKHNIGKAKNRKERLNSVYTVLLSKKINILYVLFSHTDVIETFIMRVMKNTHNYGISTIYKKNNEIFYKGQKIYIRYPSIDKTRGFIIENTTKICEDYSNRPKSNTRNIVREHINIHKYYENIINFIHFTKLLNIQHKYIYNPYTFVITANIQNIDSKYICSERENIINTIIQSVRILNFQTYNTIKKTKINTEKVQDTNKCNLQIIKNQLFARLSLNQLKIIKNKHNTKIIINAIHKITIYHNTNIFIEIEKYYTKQQYANTHKCFQHNVIVRIQNKDGYLKKVKIGSLQYHNIAIEDYEQLHIHQTIIQKIFYK